MTFPPLKYIGFGLMALAALGLTACAKPEAETPQQTTQQSGQPRNVILFIGDGMGISTLTAMRILAGQMDGKPGEEHQLPWDEFPHLALIKTYNTNQQVPDSAGTGTAILSGEKTRSGVIAVNSAAPRGNCAAARGTELETLVEQAEKAGLPTGIVTTTRLTHATPAVAYAHSPDRNWESDSDMPQTAISEGCRDIASQFLEFAHGDGIEVAFGGGRSKFLPRDLSDPEYAVRPGERRDGRNLISEWQQKHARGVYVTNKAQFDAIDPATASHVLGLFEPGHMRYEADRKNDSAGEPSLRDMTETAIRLLAHKGKEKGKGYFLMVEAGRIDHAHHANNAYHALHDGVELARAVEAAKAMTREDDTLILVTADHSHSFAIAGYPKRGNPILGKVVGNGDFKKAGKADYMPAGDGKAYATLGYYSGPGAERHGPRADLADVDTHAADFKQQAAIYSHDGTHSGEDVAAFARGPQAEAVRGVMEQNLLHGLMARVLGLAAPAP